MFFTSFQFYFMEYNKKQDMQKWLSLSLES